MAGAIGTTAWALLISVTAPTQGKIPQAEQPIHFQTEAQCIEIARAINSKMLQAGVQAKVMAECAKIEYIEVPR